MKKKEIETKKHKNYGKFGLTFVITKKMVNQSFYTIEKENQTKK